jgi:uncharacterized protein YndB with AHSA1/START domain
MSKQDWSHFTKRISIKAPVLAVYRAWTSAERLETWFIRYASFRISNGELRGKMNDIHSGDTYEWLWYGQPDTVVEKGKVIETNGVDRVKFSFTGGATVTVDMRETGGETLVTLIQEDIPTDEASRLHYNVETQVGWTFYLTNLKSVLEGGLDLRNKNESIKDVINS